MRTMIKIAWVLGLLVGLVGFFGAGSNNDDISKGGGAMFWIGIGILIVAGCAEILNNKRQGA